MRMLIAYLFIGVAVTYWLEADSEGFSAGDRFWCTLTWVFAVFVLLLQWLDRKLRRLLS